MPKQLPTPIGVKRKNWFVEFSVHPCAVVTAWIFAMICASLMHDVVPGGFGLQPFGGSAPVSVTDPPKVELYRIGPGFGFGARS